MSTYEYDDKKYYVELKFNEYSYEGDKYQLVKDDDTDLFLVIISTKAYSMCTTRWFYMREAKSILEQIILHDSEHLYEYADELDRGDIVFESDNIEDLKQYLKSVIVLNELEK